MVDSCCITTCMGHDGHFLVFLIVIACIIQRLDAVLYYLPNCKCLFPLNYRDTHMRVRGGGVDSVPVLCRIVLSLECLLKSLVQRRLAMILIAQPIYDVTA